MKHLLLWKPFVLLGCCLLLVSTGCRHAVSPSAGKSTVQKKDTEKDTPSDSQSESGNISENPGLKTAVYTAEKGILTVTESGAIPEEAVTEALSGGTNLTVKGPLIPENYKRFKGKGITILDLSGVTDLSQGTVSVSMSAEGSFDYNDFVPVNFYADTSIQTVVLPDSAKVLPECAFTGCSSLVSVTGNSLEVIGYSAFYGTALQSAEFPKAREIGYNAFAGCRKLETLKLPSAEKLGNDLLYFGGNGNLSITLPATLQIPQKPEQINGEDPSHAFRGINTETVTLILSGNPENPPVDKNWQGYTWKEILSSE